MTQPLLRLFGLLLLLFPLTLAAQTPCYFIVKITDGQSGEALAGVSLKMDGEETGMRSDSTGFLKIPVTCAEHNVRLQQLGYKPFSRKITVAGQEEIPIEMENIATQIEEVVVTSQGAVRTMETPALGVSMISMKAVQKLPPAAGEVDILRGIQTLPGISAVGEGANGVNIRGGAVDQNLILLDNMPVFNPTHLLGLFSLFPTDAIREMQIYKGSVPARYGGRTAGVLDVRMSEPTGDKFRMKGGIGLISSRLHAEIPIVKDKIAWMTSSRFSFNEYLIRFYNSVLYGPVANKRIPNNKPVFVDLANKITWRPTNRDNISLTSYISYDSYRVDSLFGIANIIPRQSTMQYGHNNLCIRWNRSISETLNLNVLAVQSLYQTSTSAEDLKVGFDFDTHLRYHNAKGELTYAPSTRQRMSMGASITRYQASPAELIPQEGSSVASVLLPDERAWEAALFISDEYEVNDRLLIEPGLRYVQYWNMGPLQVPVFSDEGPKTPGSVLNYLPIGSGQVESRYGRLEPRMALRYKLTENSSAKLGYNRMNQFLQIIANNTTPMPNARWKTSNRYVPPAQSDLVSAGYFRDTKTRIWEWSLEGYYRWQHSIFDYAAGADLNINPIVETQLLKGSARAYGAELFISKKKGVMTGWLSYTYARSFEQITGDFPALQQLNEGQWFRTNIDKPHTINMLLNFQTERHNAVSFTFTYSTGRPYTAPVSFYQNGFNIVPVYTERNNARISDYHRLDFSWTINNPSTKQHRWESSWVVTVYNIYGRKNAFSYFFNPALSSFSPFKVSVFPTPLFSLTYNFKFE